jgi:hypothetical protein
MKHKVPLLRILATILGAALLLGALDLFLEAHQAFQLVEQWREAEPVRMEVDLSKAGKYSGVFHHTYPGAHGVWIHLETTPALPWGRDYSKIFDGLEARLSLIDNRGKLVQMVEWASEETSGTILTLDPTAEQGDYGLVLEVVEPALGLKDIRQELTGSYMMSGMEVLPAAMIRLAGIVVGGIGITIIAVVVVITLKRRKKTSTKQSADRTD